MPALHPQVPDLPTPTAPQPQAGLDLLPFPALRYDPDRVGDLAAVTAPPYDVIDIPGVLALEARHPRNVVRLIRPHSADLPPTDPSAPQTSALPRPGEGCYAEAAHTLAAWRAEGTLVRDEQPALYVYEQRHGTAVQRGLLGAVPLHSPRDGVVLPHEDVMPGPVADRLQLMRATRANLEPILLALQGGERTDAVLTAAVSRPALLDLTTEDGSRHRLWPLLDPGEQAQVRADLAGRAALIADGHHRYATYRRLQADYHAAGRGPGPWDAGLALLVDTARYPLHVGAIHRSVAGLGLDEAVVTAREAMRARWLDGSLDQALEELVRARRNGPAVLVANRHGQALLSAPDPAVLDACMPPEHSPRWRSLDAALTHHVLIDAVWELGDQPRRVGYHHDVPACLATAERTDGIAVLLNPVPVQEVLAIAATGERMPRKSTSFAPKPLTGLVMRLLEES